MTVQDWLGSNPISLSIWEKKYRKNNESFDEWLDRVSNHSNSIKRLIIEKKFLFGGRTLANRGLNVGSCSNCYSEGFVPDSLDGIMQVASNLAKTYKAQGGQGVSLSKVRPSGTLIGKTFTSDGIVPFMELFNSVTNSISQGGSRKGALMMSCDVWHKDIARFITIKSQEGKIDKANLSVEIDDKFMDYVAEYLTTGIRKKVEVHKVYEGHDVSYEVDVAGIYDMICTNAHHYAEPGIIFTSRFRNYNLMEFVPEYVIETCNPCGEQPLPSGGACNLGSINLYAYVVNPFTEESYFNFDELKEDLHTIVKAMDDIIDENLENHALDKQKYMAETYRNLGIGFMGFADALVALGLKYGSEESCSFTETLTNFIFKNAIYASAKLGNDRGNFPGYDPMVWKSEIIRNNFSDEEIAELSRYNHLRNCSLISIAPTGSLSTMLNISGGIEPIFALSYQRRTVSLNGEEKIYDIDVDVVSKFKSATNQTTLPDYFITAEQIAYSNRIAMQAAAQKACDTAINKLVA